MDIPDIEKILSFMDWKMITAIGLLVMAWTQFWKEYIPDTYKKIPVIKLFTLLSGMVIAYFIFDIAGVKHTEMVALFHGLVGSLFAALGYDILKGTKLGLRSSTDLKNGK